MTAAVEFILLAGFLGSGKTSLLVDWLALPEAADTAVIVNEAGEIDVDGAIIAEGGTLPLSMMSNGCVCCSLTNDLVFTVRALLEDRAKAGLPPFRRIILEGSGLVRPGPVLRSLSPLAPLGLRVRVVTACDATRMGALLDEFDEVAAQLAAAGTLVLTKLDLAPPGPAEALAASVNPLALRVVEADRAARARAAFGPAPPVDLPEPPAAPAAHPRMSVLRATFSADATWEEKLDWMENLAAFCGDRLLRVKGFVRQPGVAGGMLLIQAVGTLFSPPVAMSGSRPEGLVVILRDLGAAELRSMDPGAPVRISVYRAGDGLACQPGDSEASLTS